MNKDWKTVRLGDVCEILNGYGFKNEKYINKGIRIMRITNVQKGFVEDKTPAFYSDTEKNNLKDYMLFENDLLISLTGNVGRVALLSKKFLPAALNQRVGCLRVKLENILNINFLFTFLNSEKFENDCIFSSRGIAQKNMSREWLKQYILPLPPLETQKQIAAVLDKCTAIIQKHKTMLEKYDTLIKSRFIEMFGDPVQNPMGWTLKKLRDTTEIITGNTPSRKEKDNYGSHIEWIKTDNITNAIYVTTASESLSKKGEKLGRTVESGSILMACIAGSLRSIGRVALTDRKVAFNQQINAIVPKEYNHLFLLVLLQNTQSYVQSRVNMALKGILSKGKLEELEYIVPPLPLQNIFAAFVQQIDKSKLAVQKSLEKTETLYKALMQEYFG